jgi:hypothetical protein
MSTCQTSFSKVFFMKDDLNDELPNGTPKILILFNGVLNWNGCQRWAASLRGTMLHIYEVG